MPTSPRHPNGGGLLLALVVILCGCSPRVVEHIVRQSDTTYVDRLRVDSLYQRDSIFVREKGDTVYVYNEKVRDRWHYERDTLRLVQIDSVVIFVPQEGDKAPALTKWQTAKIRAFWYLVAGLIAALLWIFRKPLRLLLKI